MIPPLDHPREIDRLKVLADNGIVTGVKDAEYDDFVALASMIADAPIALFTIIDAKTQWFRAKKGMDSDSTPRAVSFCGHAILAEQAPMVVEDTLYDMRFCDNPLVANDPGIRFYAGIPICPAKDKLPIGTLCVIDRKPRVLSPAAIESLTVLGRILEQTILSAVRTLRLQVANDSLRRMVEQAPSSVLRR